MPAASRFYSPSNLDGPAPAPNRKNTCTLASRRCTVQWRVPGFVAEAQEAPSVPVEIVNL